MRLIALLLFALLAYWLIRRALSPSPPANPVSETERACQVLQIAWPCSAEELKAAYRARMAEYHPDKVSALGLELRELAERKSKEINAAYQRLLPLCAKQR
ncbi:DnaJ domain-containing protein [Chromobacterium haemolyticum]|uniref:DnaJ domain-containing protein n=1 Tax=Chromobacterium haemolyticum TaxID=394935 RepID=UPI00244A02F8|nr:DnaJ domain-containing protein [Chromobacterium haemolyticum]MDH0344388.1 DnaJ domain-containing protein [Chromobacterium haemolyticum]